MALPVPLNVINPNAETGDLTGWTIEVGNAGVKSSDPAPEFGFFYFHNGPSTDHSVTSQTIAIPSGNISEVDSGIVAVRNSWFQRSLEGNDEGRLFLRFLDSSSNLISDTQSLIPFSKVFPWTKREFIVPVPIGSRSIVIVIEGRRNAGVTCDAFFDEIELELIQINKNSFASQVSFETQMKFLDGGINSTNLNLEVMEKVDGRIRSSFVCVEVMMDIPRFANQKQILIQPVQIVAR